MSEREEITLLRALAANTGDGELSGEGYEEHQLYEVILANLGGTPAESDDYPLIRVLEGIKTATASE